MKRICVLLLAGLLVSVSCCALAFDLSPYVIHSDELLLEYGVKRNHTASVEREGEQQELLIFDGEGVLACRYPLEVNGRYDVAVSADHLQGGYLVVLCMRAEGNADETMRVLRVDAQGRILWETGIPKGFSYNWTVLCDDGKGGAFFVFADPGNYKLAQVWHFDAKGNVLWNKVIEAESLIFSSFSGGFDATKDRLMIAGHAVSKSRGIYDVLVLEIDREGNMEAVQRKDFSCRPDYSFDVLMDRGGAFYAHSRANYLDAENTPHVLVPVCELPDAPERRVVLRDEAKGHKEDIVN